MSNRHTRLCYLGIDELLKVDIWRGRTRRLIAMHDGRINNSAGCCRFRESLETDEVINRANKKVDQKQGSYEFWTA